MSEKEYKINIDARILELLGPNLYTNIYYVLAELIANAYDASAKNVYVISKDNNIIVEDDGNGMSYADGDINKYLNVAAETRTTEEDSYTKDNPPRKKMGRKGIGKLAALSVSNDVLVKTIKNGEKSGFILSRNIPEGNILKPLSVEEIVFDNISTKGTAIVMKNPQYRLNKTPEAIKRNLLKIFPMVNNDFKIHILTDDCSLTIKSFEEEMIGELATLNIIGDGFEYLKDYYTNPLPGVEGSNALVIKSPQVVETLTLKTKNGVEKAYDLKISGWMGSYLSTRGRKTGDKTDFPDNFISIFANQKLGEFNIIPIIGRNRLNEVFVVGQLHVDLLEETDLPDIALSNRQGYKSDDLRYQTLLKKAADLLTDAVNHRTTYKTLNNNEKLKNEEQKNLERELNLKDKFEKYKENIKSIKNNIADKVSEKEAAIIEKEIDDTLERANEEITEILDLKKEIDHKKKKILISHSSKDKILSDIICTALEYNGIPLEDILYTSNDNTQTHIPDGEKVYEYLRKFFVESYSKSKIYVVYVTSENMHHSWNCVLEVGAGWITKKDYAIFNVQNYTPKEPLNNGEEWHNSIKENENIKMSQRDFNVFINKIIRIVNNLGYRPLSKEQNEVHLKSYIDII